MTRRDRLANMIETLSSQIESMPETEDSSQSRHNAWLRYSAALDELASCREDRHIGPISDVGCASSRVICIACGERIDQPASAKEQEEK